MISTAIVSWLSDNLISFVLLIAGAFGAWYKFDRRLRENEIRTDRVEAALKNGIVKEIQTLREDVRDSIQGLRTDVREDMNTIHDKLDSLSEIKHIPGSCASIVSLEKKLQPIINAIDRQSPFKISGV